MKNTTWQMDYFATNYEEAVNLMESYVDSIILNCKSNKIWLLEHFDVFTKGSSAVDSELLYNPQNIAVVNTNRGGKYTYHGLGQRIVYPMINLNLKKDITTYVSNLQQWIILTLNEFNIEAFIKEGLVGVWVLENGEEKKIAAIGIRVRKWVAYHGIAINIKPKLENFNHIISCGIKNFGITSTYSLGQDISYQDLDKVLQKTFTKVFKNE